MGMAASQARFLGLTARKSNVEYQGQQVNQQRTALANESAGLYNQMMTLDVPTPPSSTDYYKVTYELENSGTVGVDGLYSIENLTKTYSGADKYQVVLGYTTQQIQKQDYTQFIVESNQDATTGNYTFRLANEENGSSYAITLAKNDDGTYGSDAFTGIVNPQGQKTLKVTDNVIYKVDKDRMSEIDGAQQCCTDATKDYFFYRIEGKTYFLTDDNIETLKEFDNLEPETIDYSRAVVNTQHNTTDVYAILEKSSTGRFSSIHIEQNDSYPANLSGQQFQLNVKQVFDQEGYDNAMNDYEYQKDIYEQTINEINAKTEVIQKQDQNLELRLDQLDTEQNAIKTEMDAVTKVIDDNVEKTFKTFA